MSTICFYHNADLDGHSSGAVVRYAVKEQVVLKGINYNKPLPVQPVAGDTVYFVDFSPSIVHITAMLAHGVLPKDVIIIDHHEEVEEMRQQYGFSGLVVSHSTAEVQKAGVELCWEYFFPDTPAPKWLAYLSAYDVFDKDRFDWKDVVMPFQYGMRIEPTWPNTDACYERWLDWFVLKDEADIDAKIADTIREGKTVLKYQRGLDKRLMSNSFTVEFEGLTFLAVNGAQGSNSFLTKFNPDKYDAMLTFSYSGPLEAYRVSMYGGDGCKHDLSAIARKYVFNGEKGGGHQHACGFIIKNIHTIIGG